MSNTPVLGLPEIAEGVASQTVLHNQALRLIEARIVRVLSRTTTAPPGSPAEGDSYIVPAGATGAWSGLTNQVASFVGGGWVYLTPGEGVRLWVNDADETVVFDGAAWVLSEGSAGGSGDVVGPASSTDGHFATYDGATGKLLKDTLALDTDTTLAANSDTRVASQKAVKAYVSASGGTVRLDQIATGTADSTLTTSGTVSLTSGVGAANTVGKTISIQPGAGGATTAVGGLLSLTGGAGTGNVAGGAVTITGGTTTGTLSAAVGGAVNLLGGTGLNGGAVNITSGAATSGSNTAGNVVIAGANGVGSQAVGGSISVTAGASNNAQTGGAITITAGAGGSFGGALTMRAGGGGTGGAVSVIGGTPTGGPGGAVSITAAAGVGTNQPGGNVTIRPGAATGTGNPGNIQLDGGRGAALGTTAIGGFVTLPTCAGTPTGTPVNVPTGSVATIVDTSGGKLWMFIGGAWKGYVNIDEAQNTTNRIINGKMAIDQRTAGGITTLNNSGVYALDRWVGSAAGAGTYTMAQSVNQPRAGETALAMTVGTASASPAAADNYHSAQHIEGYNIADLNYGAAGAQPFTLAFEVSSTVAGTFALAFRGATPTRSYIATFTVPTAGVFSTVAVTVAGDTAGTWNLTNGIGVRVSFVLSAGSSFVAPAANVWHATNYLTVAGCTNLMATAGAVMRIANVRLYKGSVDFGPDRRLYAEELALCQRYYCKSYSQGTVPGALTFSGIRMGPVTGTAVGNNNVQILYPVPMRIAPAITTFNAETGATGTWSNGAVPTNPIHISDQSCIVANNGTAVMGNFFFGHFTASAEL